ncbi:MAG TPA: FtsQ-type POTRA domain-containing protein [Desulfuromonadales bacterium]|nr:FtsQ-type POTRA domain-containing protein [Desulfuromonadales bacterium]
MRDFKSQKPVKVKVNRRKRQKEPRDWRKFFQRALGIGVLIGKLSLVVLLLGGAGLAARQVFHSGYFGVAKVRVENLGRVSEEEVVELSDIRPGMNIFDLELELIGRKIEENPWIATARVERVLPREVVISVRERVPKAVINLGYLYYLDADGEIFKVLGPEDSIDYPVVTGIDRRTLLENPGDCRKHLEEAVLLLDELAGRRIFSLDDVSELHIDQTDGLTLYTFSGGVPVHMGYSNFNSKLDRLERIYPELEPRLPVLKYIDLNVADRVIVKVDSRRTIGNG